MKVIIETNKPLGEVVERMNWFKERGWDVWFEGRGDGEVVIKGERDDTN